MEAARRGRYASLSICASRMTRGQCACVLSYAQHSPIYSKPSGLLCPSQHFLSTKCSEAKYKPDRRPVNQAYLPRRHL